MELVALIKKGGFFGMMSAHLHNYMFFTCYVFLLGDVVCVFGSCSSCVCCVQCDLVACKKGKIGEGKTVANSAHQYLPFIAGFKF